MGRDKKRTTRINRREKKHRLRASPRQRWFVNVQDAEEREEGETFSSFLVWTSPVDEEKEGEEEEWRDVKGTKRVDKKREREHRQRNKEERTERHQCLLLPFAMKVVPNPGHKIDVWFVLDDFYLFAINTGRNGEN